MICQRCLKETATITLERQINEHVEEIHICSNCAKDMGFNADNFILENYLQNFLGSLISGKISDFEKSVSASITCPKCNITLNQFKKSGRLGCDKCYETFANEINSIFDNVQAGNFHKGKCPKKLEKQFLFENELKSLKSELAKAIEKEDFEKAVELRDQIRKLQSDSEG